MQSIISTARSVLSDRKAPLRISDDDLVRYANDCVLVIAKWYPEWFVEEITITVPTDLPLQTLPLGKQKLLGISGLVQTSIALLERHDPTWRSRTSANAAAMGGPTMWASAAGAPNKFYTYPPRLVGSNADYTAAVAFVPAAVTATGTLPLPELYRPAIVDYVVGMAESRDNDHVLTQRAAQHLQKALTLIGAPTNG